MTMNASIGHAKYGMPTDQQRTFHSLAELMAFIEETGHEVVIGGSGDDWGITIYDDYLE